MPVPTNPEFNGGANPGWNWSYTSPYVNANGQANSQIGSGAGSKGGGQSVPQQPGQYNFPSFGGPYTQQGNTPSFDLMAGANNAMLLGGPSAGLMDQVAGPGMDAVGNMLSGQANYGLVQDAVRAGAQPTLDILAEDIMPQLRSRTVASNNPTGEIKDLNRIVPRVMRDITNTGTQAALGEYNRAMSSRDAGAGLATGLASQLAGQQSSDIKAGLAMMPQTIQTGMMPMQMMSQYGGMARGFEEQALQDSINRWNFQQNQPLEMTNWLAQIMSGTAGLGGTQTSEMASNPALGAGGGALGGAALGNMLAAPGATGLAAVGGLPFLLGGALLGLLGGL